MNFCIYSKMLFLWYEEADTKIQKISFQWSPPFSSQFGLWTNKFHYFEILLVRLRQRQMSMSKINIIRQRKMSMSKIKCQCQKLMSTSVSNVNCQLMKEITRTMQMEFKVIGDKEMDDEENLLVIRES